MTSDCYTVLKLETPKIINKHITRKNIILTNTIASIRSNHKMYSLNNKTGLKLNPDYTVITVLTKAEVLLKQ